MLGVRMRDLIPSLLPCAQNFKLNVMVDMLVLRVLELDGSGGRLGNNEATFGGKGGGGPVILKRGEMKVEDF